MRIILILSISLFLGFLTKAQTTSVNFNNLTGVTFDEPTSTLLKSASDGWKNGVAFSENELGAGEDGFVEYVVQGIADTKAFGVTSFVNPADGLNGIEHAFYISKGSLYISNNGRVVMRLGRIKDGIKLNITVQAGQANFMMNGRRIFRTTVNTTATNYVGAVIYNSGGSLIGIQTSFVPPLPPTESSRNQYTKLTQLPTGFVKEIGNTFYFSFDYKLLSGSDELQFYIWNKFHEDKSDDAIISSYSLVNGVNQFQLNLTALNVGLYTLEVLVPNGDKYYGKFQKNSLAGEEEPQDDPSTN